MTDHQLKTFKAALEAKRLELLEQLRGRVAELAIDASQPELIDWIQTMSSRDVTAGMVSRFSATLADVERSLRAIDDDCYGICTGCELPIAVKRLQSIPWAPYCVACQERFEAEHDGSVWDLHESKAA